MVLHFSPNLVLIKMFAHRLFYVGMEKDSHIIPKESHRKEESRAQEKPDNLKIQVLNLINLTRKQTIDLKYRSLNSPKKN